MTREQLEHIIRAAADIADDEEIMIVGSQAILGQFPQAPAELLVSNEADVYPKHKPERAELIDGSIGEGSPFHDTFGYYAHGVGPETATLPEGWENRLVPVRNENTRGATGWCLETHDLAASKLIAGRPRDIEFVGCLVRHRLADPGKIEARLDSTPADPEILALARSRLKRLLAG